MKDKHFSRKFNIPILGRDSIFPQFFATHLTTQSVLSEEFLLSTDQSKTKNLNSNIDTYLGSEKYIFFALGKGYLKTSDSIGLIYDPFILSQSVGANLVKNDLLYVLNKSKLLEKFLQENHANLESLVKNTHTSMRANKKIEEIFQYGTKKQLSCLIYEENDPIQNDYCDIIDQILPILPFELKIKLETLLQEKIVQSNEIYDNLPEIIKNLFEKEKGFLNKFSDQQTEERVIEIRIPSQHPIQKGLIGIYQS